MAVVFGYNFLRNAAALIFTRVASEIGPRFRPVNVALIFDLVASLLVLPIREELMLARCSAVRIWPIVFATRFAIVVVEISLPVSFALIRALLSRDMGRAFLALVATRFAMVSSEIGIAFFFRVALRLAITSAAIFRPVADSLIRSRVSVVLTLPCCAALMRAFVSSVLVLPR